MALAETASGQRASLEIPLDSAHILTARVFASGIARSLKLDDETVEILRLALTEICSDAIERRRRGRIAIEIVADAGQIRAVVAATGPIDHDWQLDRDGSTYRRTLIEALAPDAEFVEDPGGLTVMFTLSAA